MLDFHKVAEATRDKGKSCFAEGSTMQTNMKSRFLAAIAVALSATVMFGLVGCSGDSKAESGNSSEPAAATAEPKASADTPAKAEEGPSEEFTMTEDEIYEAYAGVSTDGSATAYYFGDADLTKGGLLLMNVAATENVSYMGKIEVGTGTDGTTVIQITDSITGKTIGFSVVDNGDDTLTLDLGDDGAIVMAEVAPTDIIDAINAIQSSTANVG